MNIESNLEINFHQQNEVSVFLENTASNKEEMFGEILLFCCFTLRTLVNFGSNPVASSLSLLLLQITTASFDGILDYKDSSMPKIINYPGSQGRKRFIVKLGYFNGKLNFQYSPKGFGLFASGMGYYAPASVIILMKYLAERRQDNLEYRLALEKAVSKCANVHHSGELSIANQSQVAVSIAQECYKLENDHE